MSRARMATALLLFAACIPCVTGTLWVKLGVEAHYPSSHLEDLALLGLLYEGVVVVHAGGLAGGGMRWRCARSDGPQHRSELQ